MNQPVPLLSPGRATTPAILDPLVMDNVRALDEAIAVLEALPEDEYAAPSKVGSTIGAHFRHVLDHYLCLLEGLETGLIHYEGRRRDPTIETQRAAALELARQLCWQVGTLSPTTLTRPLAVRCLAGELAERLHGDHPSTGPRELHFVLLHAVHHYSFIAVELKLRGYAVDPDFGVAPATRAWRAARS